MHELAFDNESSPRVLVLGSSGLLGSAIRRLSKGPWADLEVFWVTRQNADLREKDQVVSLFEGVRPDVVVNCAGVVGGIGKNISDSGTLLLENLQIDTNLIETSLKSGVTSYLNFSSNCTYAVDVDRPLHPRSLYQGRLEATNHAYAQAKISAMVACEIASNELGRTFRTLILSNLYGPGDNFSRDESHLVGAIVSKVLSAIESESETIKVWGTGRPLREFTYVDDVAEFIIRNIRSLHKFPPVMNLGSGEERSVVWLHELALLISEKKLGLVFDENRPDGVFSKILDSEHAIRFFDWSPKTRIEEGMRKVFHSFEPRSRGRGRS